MNDQQPPLTADPETIRTWFDTAFAHADGQLSVAAGFGGGKLEYDFFPTTEDGLAAAVRYVIALDRRKPEGIYYQSTTLRERPPKGRGREADAYCLTHLWADGDYGTVGHQPGLDDLDAPPHAEATLKVYDEAGLPQPTGYAKSGGGLNGIWLLAEAYLIGDEDDRARVKELTTGLQTILTAQAYRYGWSWDSGVGDLARLMKLPGTVNRKRGCPERATGMLPGSGVVYDLAELSTAVAELLPAAQETVAQAEAEKQARKAQRKGGPVPPPRRERSAGLHSGDGPLDVLADMLTFPDLLEPEGWTDAGQSGEWRLMLRPTAGGDAPSSAYSLKYNDHVAVNWSERSDLPVGALPRGQKLTIGTLYAHLHYGGNTSEAASDIMRAAAGRTARGAAGRLAPAVLAEVKRRCMPGEADDLRSLIADDPWAGPQDEPPDVPEPPDAPGWEEPVPLAPPAPPLLDVTLLGGIGEMAQAVSTSLQVPVDIPAWFGMATASAAIGGRRTVSPKPDWSEPVTLYCMTVAAPGEKKSPSRAAMVAPLVQEEQIRKAADKVTVAKDEQDRRIAEACVGAAEASVIKAKNAQTRQAAKQELSAVRDELEQLGEPKVVTQMLADDTTPEAAAGVLAEQGERLAVISAEGGFLGNIGGRYSNQPNLEVVLKAWSHEPHTVNRKSGPPLFLTRPNLTLALAVQPGLLSGLGDTAEVFESRGFTGRFVFSVPTSMVGRRTYDTEPIPDDVRRRYHEAITRMVKLIWDDPEPRAMCLAPEAQAVFKAFWVDWERRHLVPGELTAVEGWSKKLPGQLLRLAAVMTLFDSPDAVTVSARTMANAVALVPYLLAHARQVVDLMSAEKQSRLGPARAVLDWLRKKQPTAPVSVTEVRRGVHGQSWCESADDVNSALSVLDRNGWIRFLPQPESTGGRPAAPRFEVHPQIIGRST
ncbi:YfjI family protein [Streptomyces sp. NPDC050523]|uniref:YfjI family protein n=1 Tax=Streptomyces sp. NPDC050523 TaxID=3365622 RepID=UPI003789039C